VFSVTNTTARTATTLRNLNRGGNQQLKTGAGSCRCCTNRPGAPSQSRKSVLICAFVVHPVVRDANYSSQESKLTHGL
jgi:hypothetical protein